MADRVLQRRDTAANWAAANPILMEGELGIVIDGAKGYKIGDGVTRWNALEYPANPTSVVQELGDSEVAVMSQKAITDTFSYLLEGYSYKGIAKIITKPDTSPKQFYLTSEYGIYTNFNNISVSSFGILYYDDSWKFQDLNIMYGKDILIGDVIITANNSNMFTSNMVYVRGTGNPTTEPLMKSTPWIQIPENLKSINVSAIMGNQYYGGIVFFSTPTYQGYIGELAITGDASHNSQYTLYPDMIPDNAKYIVVTSMASDLSGAYVNITSLGTEGNIEQRINDLESIVDSIPQLITQHSITNTIDEINSSTILQTKFPDTWKRYTIGFHASLDQEWDGRIQLLGYRQFNTGRIEVDSTSVYFYNTNSQSAEPVRTVAHELTLGQFISIIIKQNNYSNYDCDIIISTQSGQFSNSSVTNYWNSAGGTYFTAKCLSGSCQNVKITFSIDNRKVWLFGDSYLDYISRNIQASSKEYITNLVLDGFPGRTSASALQSLQLSLQIAVPEVLVWALGMNDPDSSSSINTSWKSTLDQVVTYCKKYNIELVVVTIPTTPTNNNNSKNEFIRNSSFRYVDVAKAVGASDTGVWNPGLLSSDNVHPTNAGAKVIWATYLASIPEICE